MVNECNFTGTIELNSQLSVLFCASVRVHVVWVNFSELCKMNNFSDNSDMEILSQLPESDILNTVVDSEEGFGNILDEIQQDEQCTDKEPLLTDM